MADYLQVVERLRLFVRPIPAALNKTHSVRGPIELTRHSDAGGACPDNTDVSIDGRSGLKFIGVNDLHVALQR